MSPKKILTLLVACLLPLSLAAMPFKLREHYRPANPFYRVYWNEINYKVVRGYLNPTQKNYLEASLRKWCKCPVKQVNNGQNLSIIIEPFARSGVCFVSPIHHKATIICDPSPPDGFAVVMDHEVHHLVQPFFHAE